MNKSSLKVIWHGLLGLTVLIIGWQLLVASLQIPSYILPSPIHVFATLYSQSHLIAAEAMVTITETLLGFLLACIIGCCFALSIVFFKPLRYWLLPLLLISQALPTFAIAPLLVIWLGYGMASKIVTTMIILFFPIASGFYDGLKRTPPAYLDLAKIMGATKSRLFWHIKIPAALPSLATGIRVAAAGAPIGAIIGEWVGSSHGLGFLMLNANARMQIDLMFAVLLVIIVLSLILYFSVDYLLRRTIHWQQEK